MPSILSARPRHATQPSITIEADGFTVVTTEQPSMDVEAGLVIETNPAAGTEVAPGTEVTMVVSSGTEDVVVPDFTGMSQEDATKAAEDASLTITGVGVLPGSTVELSVLDTDKTASVAVQDNGSWLATFDLSDVVDNDTAFVLVEGTAADTSEYSATFKIPAAGESTDQPTDEAPAAESSGFPVWGWVLIGLAVVAIILLIVRMVGGGGDEGTSGSDTPDAS